MSLEKAGYFIRLFFWMKTPNIQGKQLAFPAKPFFSFHEAGPWLRNW